MRCTHHSIFNQAPVPKHTNSHAHKLYKTMMHARTCCLCCLTKSSSKVISAPFFLNGFDIFFSLFMASIICCCSAAACASGPAGGCTDAWFCEACSQSPTFAAQLLLLAHLGLQVVAQLRDCIQLAHDSHQHLLLSCCLRIWACRWLHSCVVL